MFGEIIEKKLGIPADYQYQAIRSKNWLQSNWHRNKYAAFLLNNHLDNSLKILDLGVGSGNFELLFASKVSSITAVDYNDEALNFLQSKLKENSITNVETIHSDIRNLPSSVTSKLYDLIVIIDTIEHIKIEESASMLNNAYSLLKDNGKIFIITPNYQSLWVLLEKFVDKFGLVPKLGDSQHQAQFNKGNLVALLKESHFRNINSFSFNLISYWFPVKWVSTLLVLAESKVLGNKGCLLVVRAQK